MFASEGCPSTLVTDNGVQLTSGEMESFLKECNIKHMCTSLYEPHENGQVERFNRDLKTFVTDSLKLGGNWINSLRETLWVYHIKPHSTTQVSPFKSLKGRDPASCVCPWWFKNKCQTKFTDKECVHDTAKRVEIKQNKTMRWYNDKWKTKVHKFQVGDWVRILRPGIMNKSANKFGKPIQIKKVFSNSVITQAGKVWNIKRLAKWPNDVIFQHNNSGIMNHFNTKPCDKINKETIASRVTFSDCMRQKPKRFDDFI